MRLLALGLLLFAQAACTTVLVRSPVPGEELAELSKVAPYGIPGGDLRIWGDTLSENDMSLLLASRRSLRDDTGFAEGLDGGPVQADWLALSGGGPDGAFGAGLLAGWTEHGDRPVFQGVTGVSTGAIIALFGFLGPEYDPALREIYTTYDTDDVSTTAILAGLLGGTALLDTSGYRRLIDRYIDDEVVARLSVENSKGRILLIGTTNLDAARPVIWNVTGIAGSGHPSAKQLIRDIIQASSAIPAAFPPVLVPVEAGGRRYDEMHVDGGATQQVMLFSPQISTRDIDEALGIQVERRVFVVINNKLKKPYEPVRPRIGSIAGTAISSLISGSGSGDVYKIYAIAERDGFDLNVTWIPRDFDAEADEIFDPEYMSALYDLGFEIGQRGGDWSPYPPDFAPE